MNKVPCGPGLIACALAREAASLSSAASDCNLKVFGPGDFFAGEFSSFLAANSKPPWALLVGFSGSLQPNLKPGDLILGRSVLGSAGIISTSPLGEVLAPPILELEGHIGPLFHSETLVGDPEEKKRLGSQKPLNPLAVDMESADFTRICDSLDIPWGILRVVFDQVEDPLPPGMERWCRPDGTENFWEIVRGLLLSPRWWGKIPAWIKTSKTCAVQLRRGVEKCLKELPR